MSFALACVAMTGCAGDPDPTGLYVSRNNVNTIDTVRILKGGRYINQLYRKQDKSLVYTNTGRWSVKAGAITFDKFFAEEDEAHGYEFTRFDDVLIMTRLPLETRKGRLIIHHKAMYDNIYLERIAP
ncbi:hypothetical protein [Hymenobacter aerophilus]|uniref:hypothetical protein n=1 Tax=Hymenobacter aerophilus TaxID=119644 RepID=UPI0012FB776E|nr:hypothetical protein [Hymenobacter aerophilus]